MEKLMNEITFYGVTKRLSNQELDNLGAFWQQTGPKLPQDTVIAMYHNYESNEEGTYDLTIGSTTQFPETEVHQTVKQTYMIFAVPNSNVEGVQQVWQYIWEHPEIGRSFTTDFEYYHKDGTIEVYIAINDK